MELKEPVEIDFLEFFKTGKFDCLQLNQNQEFILNNFPAPDDRFDEKMKKNGFDIWLYGNIELHFFEGILFLIFSDNFNNKKLNGGKRIKTKNWIFENSRKLKLLFVITKLNAENIDFKKKTDKLGIFMRLESGIELTFENIDDKYNFDPNDYHLTSFSLIEESKYKWS